MKSIEESVVLITGATKGIGFACAELFSQKKATVLCAARRPEPSLESRLREKGAKNVKFYPLDIRLRKQCESLAQEIQKDFGGVDILVNNAGIGIFSPIYEMDPDDWDKVIQTNLSGLFYLTRSIVPQMIERGGGYIVNIGSLASRNTFSGASAYCASKFALLAFSECTMLDLREKNIKVSIVMPGSVNTVFGENPVEEDRNTWKLTAKDVAQSVWNIVHTQDGSLVSRVEMRPLKPQKR